jgi:tRNA(fMet)-specific endonuclease VapC
LILDTKALSAIAEGEPGATKAIARANQVAIPVIVLGEYRFGIAHSRRKREYEGWLAETITFSRVLEVNEETANWYVGLRGQLKKAGTPIPSNDAWIAALCRQHSLPLLSRDRHFDLVTALKRIGW